MMADFDERKHAVLQGLASDEKDKSRAGGVDAPIAALIDRINGHPLYFTTSSCSGRISIFSEDDGKKTKKNKKGGDWVYVSHATAVDSEVRHWNSPFSRFIHSFRQHSLLEFVFQVRKSVKEYFPEVFVQFDIFT